MKGLTGCYSSISFNRVLLIPTVSLIAFYDTYSKSGRLCGSLALNLTKKKLKVPETYFWKWVKVIKFLLTCFIKYKKKEFQFSYFFLPFFQCTNHPYTDKSLWLAVGRIHAGIIITIFISTGLTKTNCLEKWRWRKFYTNFITTITKITKRFTDLKHIINVFLILPNCSFNSNSNHELNK